MMRLTTFLLLAICSTTVAQEPPESTPEAEHQLLAEEVGTWVGTMTMWPAGADGPAVEMPMKETVTMIAPGFWTTTKMTAGPFEGRGQNGYDPIKKEYVTTWIDNSTPHLSVLRGQFDKEKKQMVMFYDGIDIETQKAAKFKAVNEHIAKDARRFTMYQQNATDKSWRKLFVIKTKRESEK